MKAEIISLIMFTFGIFFGVACEQVSPFGNSEQFRADTTLIGPTWQLMAFVKADGEHITIDGNRDNIPQAAYSIVFTKQPRTCKGSLTRCGQWQMEATGHPNQGGFSYNIHSIDSNSLSIYFHGQTKVGLPEGSKEPEFFDALKATTHYRINGTQLRLFYGDNGKVLLFEPLESVEE